MTAVTLDSENELRRSGGFELIFPVASTANKYLKFFDGPRPLERMLANSNHGGGDAASGKAALNGVRAWRGSRRGATAKTGRNGRGNQGQGCASSVSPVRDLKVL